MPALTTALVDSIHLSYPLAFLAGLVSFASPCVFPLVPAYIGYLGGRAGDVADGPTVIASSGGEAVMHRGPVGQTSSAGGAGESGLAMRVPVLANGVAFVLGFTVVFVTVFYVLTALDVAFLATHRRQVNLVAGVIVLVLGLQVLGVLRLGSLMRERRHLLAPERVGLIPSFVLGLSFAFGWTPCIGPQLAAILRVAQQGDFAGFPVMVTYCLGLALPFLVVAALTDRLQGHIRSLNRHLGLVNLAAGALLLVLAVLLIADSATIFNRWVPQTPFEL